MKGAIGVGDVSLFGEMLGEWNDPFGIQGFDLSNVVGSIKFGATGLSEFGIGFTTKIGHTEVEFAGGVAAPDFADTFLVSVNSVDV